MKLKEFKETMVWQVADCVEYLNENGEEIKLPNTEIQRRKFENMEVIDHGTMIGGDIATLEVYLR